MATIESEIGGVLAQIRALSAELNATRVQTPAGSGEIDSAGFGELMRKAVAAVSEQQQSADALAAQFQAGDPNTSIAEVVVEMQKASISFQAMTEARNRIVEAYREIMNMSV